MPWPRCACVDRLLDDVERLHEQLFDLGLLHVDVPVGVPDLFDLDADRVFAAAVVAQPVSVVAGSLAVAREEDEADVGHAEAALLDVQLDRGLPARLAPDGELLRDEARRLRGRGLAELGPERSCLRRDSEEEHALGGLLCPCLLDPRRCDASHANLRNAYLCKRNPSACPFIPARRAAPGRTQ